MGPRCKPTMSSCNIDDDFLKPEVLSEFGTRRPSLRPRFTPHQARADARTRAVDRGIQDTYLQHGLKEHPSVLT